MHLLKLEAKTAIISNNKYWQLRKKKYLKICMPSEYSEQSARMRRLFRVYAGRFKFCQRRKSLSTLLGMFWTDLENAEDDPNVRSAPTSECTFYLTPVQLYKATEQFSINDWLIYRKIQHSNALSNLSQLYNRFQRIRANRILTVRFTPHQVKYYFINNSGDYMN